ncbi:class I SAM-dependent methyltransferase [Candidatus Kuenenbacteria bacterium]|nr:class I SAM-dependent methyltransferase [Candidatus Kuenenbacteria bacterium]
MDAYKKTKQNYEKGIKWHFEKSRSYDWSKQRKIFAKYLSDGAKILDAGCGGSDNFSDFIKMGFEMTGLDYSKKTISEIRKKFPKSKLYCCDLRKIKMPDNYYDGIWACASLINLRKIDISKVLTKFRKIVRDEGIIFVSLKKGNGEKMVTDLFGERMFSFFSKKEFITMAEQIGFKIKSVEIVTDNKLTKQKKSTKAPDWICLYLINKK